MCMGFACICICVQCACSVQRGQKRALGLLQLELLMFGEPPCGYRELDSCPFKEQQQVPVPAEPFLQPLIIILLRQGFV